MKQSLNKQAYSIYLCNQIELGHEIKTGIISLFNDYPSVPVYKIGFLNNWQNEPMQMEWREYDKLKKKGGKCH